MGQCSGPGGSGPGGTGTGGSGLGGAGQPLAGGGPSPDGPGRSRASGRLDRSPRRTPAPERDRHIG
ncbi:MAG: hypothetical protein EA001_08060 [Oscillatoriales cyanobacterium]|nr:MAG: hypothetical protein EA001_08060 [Oscillatoriales cyanobacterium]